MPPVLWRGWIPFCRCTEGKKVRNKQVVFVSVVFFVGAIVGWISVSEIYYSRMTGLNESSVISEETYNDKKQKESGIQNQKN
ncbi:hypothetical protein [Escherichia coli]|uniref:hypothetical protein n=1 Tax=Escherichia coli TaxID=562 RepID=UPI001F4A9A07